MVWPLPIPNRMFAGVFLICWSAPTSEMFSSNREGGERCSFGVSWLFSCYFRSLVKSAELIKINLKESAFLPSRRLQGAHALRRSSQTLHLPSSRILSAGACSLLVTKEVYLQGFAIKGLR